MSCVLPKGFHFALDCVGLIASFFDDPSAILRLYTLVCREWFDYFHSPDALTCDRVGFCSPSYRVVAPGVRMIPDHSLPFVGRLSVTPVHQLIDPALLRPRSIFSRSPRLFRFRDCSLAHFPNLWHLRVTSLQIDGSGLLHLPNLRYLELEIRFPELNHNSRRALFTPDSFIRLFSQPSSLPCLNKLSLRWPESDVLKPSTKPMITPNVLSSIHPDLANRIYVLHLDSAFSQFLPPHSLLHFGSLTRLLLRTFRFERELFQRGPRTLEELLCYRCKIRNANDSTFCSSVDLSGLENLERCVIDRCSKLVESNSVKFVPEEEEEREEEEEEENSKNIDFEFIPFREFRMGLF